MGILLLAAAYATWRYYDFRIFYDASHRLLKGQDLYASRPQLEARIRNYYVLPPIVAVVCVPLSYLPFVVAGSLYGLVMIAALAVSLRLFGVTDVRCYIVLLFWMPVLQTLGEGTIEPLLVPALALAWRHRDRRLLGTVPLGLAIAVKLFVWPVLLWLVLTGRIRRAIEALAATLVALLVPWAVIGFQGFTWYPHMLRLLVRNEQAIGWSPPSSSLFGPVAVVADLLSIGLVVAAARSVDGDRRAFSAAVLVSLVLSPLVWLHYYVVLIVPVALASRRFSWLWCLPVLACWPYADSHSALGVKIWIWGLLGLVAFFTLSTPNSMSPRAGGLERSAGS